MSKIDLDDPVYIAFETWFHLNKQRWKDEPITSIVLYDAFLKGYDYGSQQSQSK